jgi:hypothetical protein
MGSIGNATAISVTFTQEFRQNVTSEALITEPLLGNGEEANARQQERKSATVHSRLVSLDLFRGLICMIMAW